MLRILTLSAAGVALAVTGLTENALAQDVVYVGYSHTEQASMALMEEEFAEFTAEHPDIEVELVGYPWRDTFQQLVLQQQSGAAPDLAQISPAWANPFAELDALVDLNDVFGREWLEARFSESALRMGQVDGKQVAIPDTGGSIGMVANGKVLEAAGVNEIPKTIEEFTAALRAVKEAYPSSVPFAISTKNPGVMHTDFNTVVWAFGGEIIDADGNVVVDSDASLAALEWLTSLMQDGLIAPDIQRSDARQLHARGEAAFSFDAPQLRGFVNEMAGEGNDISATMRPMATPVIDDSIIQRAAIYGRGYILFKQDGHAVTQSSPAAIMLSDLFLDPGYQVKNFEVTGNFPSHLEAASSIDDPYVNEWLEYAETATETDTARFPNAADLQNIVAEEYQAAILGAKVPADALRDMQARLESALEQ